jgi:hypothetical protein
MGREPGGDSTMGGALGLGRGRRGARDAAGLALSRAKGPSGPDRQGLRRPMATPRSEFTLVRRKRELCDDGYRVGDRGG